MSEYQYYEFQALDKPLSKRQLSELRAISTRARITAVSFVNDYQWGDLKADPKTLMARYFDAHLYLSNWGVRRLMLRLPKQFVDQKSLSAYCRGSKLGIRKAREHVILDFYSEDDPDSDDFLGTEGWLGSLIPLRTDLLEGDLRALYIGWLLSVQAGELGNRDREPPMPIGMNRLSASLEALIDFLRVDPELVRTAVRTHPDRSAASQRMIASNLRRWVAKLPVSDKNDILVRLAQGKEPHVRSDLLRRFRLSQQASRTSKTARTNDRTVGQLLAAIERGSRQ
jgi:hypothetical protein